MTPAICTQCGASVEVDPKQEAAVCKYCKTPYIVEKVIWFRVTFKQL
jgi:DNA-directed RNA polymerase subunit RPC12/RpoP